MRASWIAAGLAVLAAGCGGAPGPNGPSPGTPEGDTALLTSAQVISDAIGGCARPADGQGESRVVNLESGTIVMLACGQSDFAFTNRLFAAAQDGSVRLLSLPDYDEAGWFATDQASLPELDAGSGTLTTFRQTGDSDVCGSEGRYSWNGERFVVEEMRWRACTSTNRNGPPYPVIWPTPIAPTAVPDGATPAP